ncbi:MAG: hypothetical protein ACYSU0_10995 [Planctomycetota bacterium]|jgi:hypothetical protein
MGRLFSKQGVPFAVAAICIAGCARVPRAATPLDRAAAEVGLGTQKVLLEHGQLGLKYFPDGALSVLPPTPQAPCRMIVPVGIWTYLVEGKGLDGLTKATRALAPGKGGEFDNGYAGISGVYRHGDGKLYGFYHAEDQEDMPPIGGGVPGFFCSIGMAVSEDDGRSWRKLGQAITSAKPKSWTAFPNQPDRGAGEVCVVVSRDGKHLLAYYTEHSRMESRGVQICLARADISKGPPLPGAWRKYRHGRFDQPGIGGLDTPVLSAAHMDNADAAFPHVSYSEYLGRFVMVFNINVWKEYVEKGRTLERSGIYVAYSATGVQWSKPDVLVRDYAVSQPGKSVSWHPTIVWSDAGHRAAWLVYSYSDKWNHAHLGGTPHYMVGREMRFTRSSGARP